VKQRWIIRFLFPVSLSLHDRFSVYLALEENLRIFGENPAYSSDGIWGSPAAASK
jgi:hypothetical protein